jgi:hypothetical protein
LLLGVLAACTPPTKPLPPLEPMTLDAWIARCRDRLDVARLAVAHGDRVFAAAEVGVSSTPFVASLHVTVDIGDAYYSASVQHRHACAAPELPLDMGWKDVDWGLPHDIVVGRKRRLGGDEAVIEVNRTPKRTAGPFKREMERALEACLLDARRVPIAKLDCARRPDPDDTTVDF